MKTECEKCGYKITKCKEKFGYAFCDFCFYFSPDDEESLKQYANEKVNFREIQTYRKQGILPGIKQKRGMSKKAKTGKIMNRAPFGYKIENNELVPGENSKIIETIYEDFLKTNLSLNRFSKKYGLSINGIKKVLTNFTYLGKIKFDGELHEGIHKPLITSTLFNYVQDKLEKLGIKK